MKLGKDAKNLQKIASRTLASPKRQSALKWSLETQLQVEKTPTPKNKLKNQVFAPWSHPPLLAQA
jgi:hypothetical protein